MPGRPAVLRPLTYATRIVPVIALVGCLYLLSSRLDAVRLQDLGAVLHGLDWGQWAGAVLLTGLSFAAIGQYDAVIHRVLGTGVQPGRARAAGVRAIALSQTVGFSSLSGGLVRLRCLPELDLWTVTRLSLLVSLSFLAAWAVLAGGVVLISRGGPVALILGLIAVIIWVVIRFRPDSRLPGLSPRIGAELLFWTLIDTTCAALVLGLLLPAGVMPGFQTLFAAYLLALGAGLLSQSPAGLGAFELTLLLLLPQIDAPVLLAAVLAYRVIYFLLPAVIALVLLIRPSALPVLPVLQTARGIGRLRALARAPRAEWGLAHQGAEVVLSRDQASGWLLRRAGWYLVALGQPLGRPELADLAQLARSRGRAPALYKCDARTAATARQAGWSVMRISQEAVLRLDRWSAEQPGCRQMRRKLRQAQTAGLRIVIQPQSLPLSLPLAEMAAVARHWVARNGGEKGFSMGRFDPALLQQQQVVLGYLGEVLVGFASFHHGRAEWSLDLMRYGPEAPAGTMHALVSAGLSAARRAGVAQVSLAAVPVLPGALAWCSDRWPGSAGLRQFKCSFGPVWRPLYLCAPTASGAGVAAATIAVAVHWPAAWPLVTGNARPGPAPDAKPHHHLENFQFENGVQACNAQDRVFRRATAAIPADLRPVTGRPDDPRAHQQRPFPPA